MKKLSNEEWHKKCKLKNKDYKEYLFLEPYVRSRDKIKVRHLVCGFDYYVLPRDFMRGVSRCPKCLSKRLSQSNTKNPKLVIEEAKRILGDSYEILNCFRVKNSPNSKKPKGTRCMLTIKHLTCEKTYTTRADHILSDKRMCSCTRKTKSFGEERIKNYFIQENIKYESPKKFNDLVDQLPLHYDFYLDKYNILIEYQGQQHYDREHQISNGDKGWELQQAHDKAKRNYAKLKGFNLIEIPYTVNNQEDINIFLENTLNKFEK